MAQKKNDLYTLDMYVRENRAFKLSNLYDFYEKFQDINSCNQYEEFCIPQESYRTVVPEVREIYNKLVIILKMISDRKFNFVNNTYYDENESCMYLKYWFLDQLIAEGISGIHINNLFNILSEQNINEKFPDLDCKFYSINLLEVQQLKKIYDYFLFHDTYGEDENTIIHQISNSRFCETIRNATLIYNRIEHMCKNNNIKGLCIEFNKYIKDKINVFEFSSFSCSDIQISDDYFYHEDYASYVRPKTIWRDFITSRDGDHAPSNNSTDPYESTKSKIPTSVSLSMAGALIMFFAFYKFTPLRAFLSSKIQSIKMTWENANEEEKQILLNEYPSELTNMNDEIYNISYHSY
ncbi:PIR protein [Plasmodium ovale]|uniref:PIR Superfamily Protein n=2 Tax=Plasmodium ovale TaxID=36330 RepID=A0A1A8XE88_PLAOA|nr:PIR Superfamily Protein [Plasmodium ovale curtisi]SBT02656.1 PIR Superfamily Protein [Plasmodium ovale curtisi]SBT83675.1 PIR protein [Plasmodium ovale]